MCNFSNLQTQDLMCERTGLHYKVRIAQETKDHVKRERSFFDPVSPPNRIDSNGRLLWQLEHPDRMTIWKDQFMLKIFRWDKLKHNTNSFAIYWNRILRQVGKISVFKFINCKANNTLKNNIFYYFCFGWPAQAFKRTMTVLAKLNYQPLC